MRNYASGAPLTNVPLYAIASLSIHLPDQPPGPTIAVPLGLLSSDHAGYASFDLSVLREPDVAAAFSSTPAQLAIIVISQLQVYHLLLRMPI